MKPDRRPRTASHVSAVIPSSPRIRERRCFLALALAIALGLAPLAPSAWGQTLTTLYSFAGSADGYQPAGLVRDGAGNLYGTTLYGGGCCVCPPYPGCGTVFKLDASGHHTVLHTFTGRADGETPQGTLVLDPSGNLYGVTFYGGDHQCGYVGGCGTVFKVDTSGHKKALYTFSDWVTVANPDGLTSDAEGNFYGTTYFGSVDGGTVFKLDPAHNLTVLHGFSSSGDGANPSSGVIRDQAGNLFGTTSQGGSRGAGTIFEIDSTGKETVLHSFDYPTEGGSPGGLTLSGWDLYGTASSYGVSNAGTVFKLDKSGTFTVLYSFTGGNDGYSPSGHLASDGAGNLYGTTFLRGAYGFGTVFKMDETTGQITTLYSFQGGADGRYPANGVIRDRAGNLYGTTDYGGTFDAGTIFKITP